ncbi:hypothetical protein DICA1_C16446 [Diutina catenulata]
MTSSPTKDTKQHPLPTMKYACEYLPRLGTTSVVSSDRIVAAEPVNGYAIAVKTVASPPDGASEEASEGALHSIVLPSSQAIVGVAPKPPNGVSVVMEPTEAKENFVIDDYKWSVADLRRRVPRIGDTYKFVFRCRKCHAEVVDSSHFKFLDMPSEYWYELMDMWHCHKPDNFQETSRKYENIRSSPQEVLVGSYYLLVHPASTPLGAEEVGSEVQWQCRQCHAPLGTDKLNKWCLELVYGDTVETYSVNEYFYSVLMDKVNMAVRKFRVETLEVWLVNVGIGVSINGVTATQAAKIMYRENASDDVDELTLHHHDRFVEGLKQINAQLPASIQQTGPWQVSYLAKSGEF